MTDAPRRPILRLKGAADQPSSPPPPPPARWKCRPCGTAFDLSAELADDDAVRCPSCNARLGKAAQFRDEPPDLTRLRARPAPPPAPEPVAPPIIKPRKIVQRAAPRDR